MFDKRQITTPKRRHSSLFQRMEQEIQKISKKLSVAKNSARLFSNDKANFVSQKYRQSSQAKTLNKHKKQMSMINQLSLNKKQNDLKSNKEKCLIMYTNRRRSSIMETVRFHDRNQKSPLSGNKTIPMHKKKLNFSNYKKQNLEETVFNLQQENKDLSKQIQNLEKVCQSQSYRIGYMTSFYQEKQKQLQLQNSQMIKQNVYLRTICKYYKNKALQKML